MNSENFHGKISIFELFEFGKYSVPVVLFFLFDCLVPDSVSRFLFGSINLWITFEVKQQTYLDCIKNFLS